MSQSKVFSDYKSIRASIDAPFEDTVNMIDAVYEGLRVKAQKICDDWWDIKFRKELDIYRPVKNSILGTRIKTNQKGYFYCEWYYNSFSTINGKKKVYSNAIRSLKNGHSCRDSTDWMSYNYLKSLYLIDGCKAEILDFLQSDQEAITA